MNTSTALHHPAIRVTAFYLPQFHPIPENDLWWGKGFTEWTNVAKAKPLFRGHYQPRLPADLGFYDLRVPETRAAQAEMAQKYGIEGFCYWHYWFAGKRLLERPFNEVLRSGEPDFPFCLAWANQSWTGIWHGAPERILIKQTYGGAEDRERHFQTVLEAFSDDRYITVDNRPVFVIQCPWEIPEPKRFTDHWRQLATKSGLRGIYFIGVAWPSWVPTEFGFDGSVVDNPGAIMTKLRRTSRRRWGAIYRRLMNNGWSRVRRQLSPEPTIYSYEHTIEYAVPPLQTDFEQYPCPIPDWDNTPRVGINGVVFHKSTPELFRLSLSRAIAQVCHRDYDKRLVFVKSWNEWAEGNYLEPDQRFGKAYLGIVRDEAFGSCHDPTPPADRKPPNGSWRR